MLKYQIALGKSSTDSHNLNVCSQINCTKVSIIAQYFVTRQLPTPSILLTRRSSPPNPSKPQPQLQPIPSHSLSQVPSHPIHLRNSLVPTTSHMLLTFREKPINHQSQNREQEHHHAPEQLMRGRTARLEDFHCTEKNSISTYSPITFRALHTSPNINRENRKRLGVERMNRGRGGRGDALKTRISRINTTKPNNPPPVPYFHALPCELVLTVSSAIARDTSRSWRRNGWDIVMGTRTQIHYN